MVRRQIRFGRYRSVPADVAPGGGQDLDPMVDLLDALDLGELLVIISGLAARSGRRGVWLVRRHQGVWGPSAAPARQESLPDRQEPLQVFGVGRLGEVLIKAGFPGTLAVGCPAVARQA